MKKLALTIAIVLGISLGAFAQKSGGLFKYGAVSDEEYYGAGSYYGSEYYDEYYYYNNYNYSNRDGGLFTTLFPPLLPYHDSNDNQDAPIGGGALLLIGFGAAYALKKRQKK